MLHTPNPCHEGVKVGHLKCGMIKPRAISSGNRDAVMIGAASNKMHNFRSVAYFKS
jgi:hypothetical protein